MNPINPINQSTNQPINNFNKDDFSKLYNNLFNQWNSVVNFISNDGPNDVPYQYSYITDLESEITNLEKKYPKGTHTYDILENLRNDLPGSSTQFTGDWYSRACGLVQCLYQSGPNFSQGELVRSQLEIYFSLLSQISVNTHSDESIRDPDCESYAIKELNEVYPNLDSIKDSNGFSINDYYNKIIDAVNHGNDPQQWGHLTPAAVQEVQNYSNAVIDLLKSLD